MNNRRQWLKGAGLGVLGLGAGRVAPAADDATCAPKDGKLLLQDFRPKSMLHVAETHVQKPRYPVIDVHSHLTWTTRASKGVSTGEEVTFNATPKDALAVMDRK